MSRRVERYSKRGSSKRKKTAGKDNIAMNNIAGDVPDPDYGDSVKLFDSPVVMRKHVRDEPQDYEPDYDSDPDPDYGQTQSHDRLPVLAIPPKPETAPKPAGGVRMFPTQNLKIPVRPLRPAAKTSSRASQVRDSQAETLQDLAKLSELSLDTITDCIEQRYQKDLIYTNCGDILISVNPFKDVQLCSPEYFSEYTNTHLSDRSHLFAVSAKAYQNLMAKPENQIILVSGESGAGKTEATKLLVRHIMSIGGSEYVGLQDRIIEINPLLEAFGNAKTRLNNNSSRFTKLLSMNVNADGKIESARVKDYMLEKSRVVHQESGERNFHSFYAFLEGASTSTLKSLFIDRSDEFRILGQPSLNQTESQHYRRIYEEQQSVFKLIKLKAAEIQDVNIIMAAVLHLGNIQFEESYNDCVVIQDEDVVHIVATLLQVDVTEITRIFLERTAKTGKTRESIKLSKNKKQAEDERDATAKSLYERMFGWLVRRINDALKAETIKNIPSIGILDICGFENLVMNSLEQLCINIMNEQLQNFMNKEVIEDERQIYLEEGLEVADVDVEGINNDAVLNLFMKKYGVLDLINEDTKSGLADDKQLVNKMATTFKASGIYIPPEADIPEFSIKHFAGKVNYNARSFLMKNRDTLSDDMIDCFKTSQSTLIQDLFSAPTTETGSISMANFNFRGSRKPSTKFVRPVSGGNLSESINSRRLGSSMLGNNQRNQKLVYSNNHKTHLTFFKKSLTDLQTAMSEACPFFVRCIKPNDRQEPDSFWRDRVKMQLQYNGVKEVARIRTSGFPFRYPKERFARMYEKITDDKSSPDTIFNILMAVDADISQYKIGNTQIFLKELLKKDLDDMLSEVKMKEDEEKRRQKEENKRKQEEEKKRKASETKQSGQSKRKSDFITFSEIEPTSLSDISEAQTPLSSTRDSTYNSPEGSSTSRNTSWTQLIEDPEDSSEEESENDEPKPVAEKMNPAWDIVQEITEEIERQDVHEQRTLMIVKFVVYIILFAIILGTLVIEKISFLLLVRELSPTIPITDKKKETTKDMYTTLLLIAICVPYIIGWLITVAKLCFGNFKVPSIATWIWVFIMENLHAIGLCLLVFRVLPNFDVIRSAMVLSATAIVPTFLKFTMSSSDYSSKGGPHLLCEPTEKTRSILRGVLDMVAMLLQLSVIPLLLCAEYFDKENSVQSDPWLVVEIIFSFLLISCSYWENFMDGRLFCELKDHNWFKNAILKTRYDLQQGRHYPFLVTFLWKIGLSVLLCYLLCDEVNFYEAFAEMSLPGRKKLPLKAFAPIIALTLAAFVAFYVSFGACMFQMQTISLTIPACLATPVVIAIFYLDDKFKFLEEATQSLNKTLPFDPNSIEWYHFVSGAVWWISLLIVTRHMWRPQVDKTANMARVFLTPIYCGILTTESIMLNRRRNPCKVYEDPEDMNMDGEITVIRYKLRRFNNLNNDEDDLVDEFKVKDEEAQPPSIESKPDVNPTTPMLYACATMWHETRTEMVQLLKSLYRLDRDQYIRRIANERVQGYDPEFYNFEAHIFFDDAMEPDDNDEQVPNRWVKELVACMDVACSSVHSKPMKVFPPTKMPTPYGGQLIWEMPGENHLFVHMKDIKKIRNRKRWSQVMYMYYLLGYRHIMASKHELLEKLKKVNFNQGNHGLKINEINYLLGEESALKAQNTFILALDGDTDFSPGSIKILLDRMKDEKVGAACGRIHPIGNGPMVWYQKFEYAIGHWLQKSAEHVFGCVLCSPGCFSLFRAAALMDTNVMKKYTTEPTEPGHHLQYDQGEDRWLCTLMLQQGYRIEYAAAADAWTFAPEGFFEFFNQRRRWMPSTIANILDLLGSASVTTKRNANMSTIYILYQWLLMLMTILGPGTILMMIAGAVKLVFDFSLIGAYMFATVPAVVFTFICFWFSSKIQLIVALILSVVYTFIMMIVLVGTIVTATTNNIFHPSVIVIVMLVGIFVIAGICHPQEIGCLIHGVIYLLTIPSGYLLLVIYSIVNMNDVSWGTREVPTKAQRIEMERKKKEKEELMKNKPKRGFWAKIFNRGEEHIRELTKLIKTLVPQKTADPLQQMGIAIAGAEAEGQADNPFLRLLSKIELHLKQLTEKIVPNGCDTSHLTSVVVEQPGSKKKPLQQHLGLSSKILAKSIAKSQRSEGSKKVLAVSNKSGKKIKGKKPRDELTNPLWAEDKDLGGGQTVKGNIDELEFWRDFVTKYLLPIRPTIEEKKKIADGLRDLRNSSTFGLIITNLLWMALNFMFQYTNAARFQIDYSYSNKKYKIEESALGLGFVFLLLGLLILQMGGMLVHRLGTLQHLLAVTEIKICKTKLGKAYNSQRDREDIIQGIKKVLKLPMTGDPGYITKEARPTNGENNFGVTFAPKSSRGLSLGNSTSAFMDNLGKSLRYPGLTNSFANSQNKNTLTRHQRLVNGNVRQRLMATQLGKSLLPPLPPQRQDFQPLVPQSTNIRFTQRELAALPINILENPEPDDFRQMGAMGRTLFQKTQIINEEIDRNHHGLHNGTPDWNRHDVYQDTRSSIYRH